MKNKVFLFSILLTIAINLQGQEYCKERYVADSLFRVQNFSASVIHYKNLLPDFAKRKDLYKIAACYSWMNQKDSSIYYFELALEKGFYYPSGFGLEKEKNLAYIKDTPHYESYLKKIKDNQFKNININDSALYRKLIERKNIDQFYRHSISRMQQSDSTHTSLYEHYVVERSRNDSLNAIFLDSVLNQSGRWPGLNLVDWDGDEAAWLIAQHADAFVGFQEKCFEFLLKANQIENTNPHNVAYLYDRIKINKGEKQRYGTQMRVIDNKVNFINLEDQENVEYYRACYQLPPISLYQKALEERYLKK